MSTEASEEREGDEEEGAGARGQEEAKEEHEIEERTAPHARVVYEAIRAEGLDGQWVYGRDWANLGYKATNAPWLRNFSRSIQDAWKQDWKNRPLSELEILKGVDKFGPDGQVSMLIDVTGSASI